MKIWFEKNWVARNWPVKKPRHMNFDRRFEAWFALPAQSPGYAQSNRVRASSHQHTVPVLAVGVLLVPGPN